MQAAQTQEQFLLDIDRERQLRIALHEKLNALTVSPSKEKIKKNKK